jgi:hypothetical protein
MLAFHPVAGNRPDLCVEVYLGLGCVEDFGGTLRSGPRIRAPALPFPAGCGARPGMTASHRTAGGRMVLDAPHLGSRRQDMGEVAFPLRRVRPLAITSHLRGIEHRLNAPRTRQSASELLCARRAGRAS